MMALARGMLLVVMAIAAIAKLRAPHELVPVMRAMGLPLARPATVIALGLIELAAVALLVVSPVAGCALVLALLVAFTLGLISALRRRESIACHCFGAGSAPIGRSHLVRNGLLIAISISGLLVPGGELDSLAIGAIAGGAITAWDELAVLFTSFA